MSPKFTSCIPNLLFKSTVAEDDLDFAMIMSFCKIMIDYIIKRRFTRKATGDCDRRWHFFMVFCEATTLPNIAKTGNVQQC